MGLTTPGDGDPSQDVKVASVLLLVDGNLVLLQPSQSPTGDLKYDMRVVSHDVEYYILMRDQLSFNFAPPVDESLPASPSAEMALNMRHHNLSLRDSLWTFCGKDLLAWGDVQDVLRREDVPKAIEIPLDFYPLSVLLNKGIVLGVESEMTQRRDTTFAVLKFAIRVSQTNLCNILLTNDKDPPLPSVLLAILLSSWRYASCAVTMSTFLPSFILPACP